MMNVAHSSALMINIRGRSRLEELLILCARIGYNP